MSNKPVLVFDFDGTICDSVEQMLEIINKLAEKYKFENINDVEVAEFRNLGTEKMIERLKIPKELLSEIMGEITQGLSDNVEAVRPVKGMVKVLEALSRRGYRMFIVTSNKKESALKLLRKFGIKNIRGIYPEAGLFGKEKLLLKLIQDQGIAAEDMVYIGDESRDIEAGKMCGCRTMAVTWGLNGKEALAEKSPDWLVEKPGQLMEIFR